MIKNHLILFISLFAIISSTQGNSLLIDGQTDDYVVDGAHYEMYVDSNNTATIKTIGKQKFSPFQLPLCENEEAYHWLKFNLDITSEEEMKWVLEVYEHHIDDFTCYIPWKNGTYKTVSTGDTKKFKEREYQHINFVFDIHKNYIEGRPFYFKLKSSNRIWGVTTFVRTNQYYTFYAVNEYFFLGVFYGILFIMGVYNLLFFFSTKERVYIYYTLYIASVGLLLMLEDGIGFSYIWSNKPYLTDLFGIFTRLLIMVSYLIYSASFLKLKTLFPAMDKLIKAALIFYIIEFLLEKTFGFYLAFIYAIPFLITYGIGIYTFVKGYKPARFFIAGSTFLVISILTILGRDYGYSTGFSFINTVLVYAMNIGITLEILILSVALGDRIKYLKHQEEVSREKIIEQLQENEKLKDKVNLELEDKVRERTHELENKNKNIFDSLQYALRIQQAVLPSPASIAEIIPKNFIFHLSKDIVSGDFYWFHKKGNLTFVAAVDCTGHGVPGAFMSIMGSNLLHFAVRELQLEDPAEILNRMSFELKKRISSKPNDLEDQYGMDMALCVIDTDTMELNFSGAFNPLVIISEGQLELLEADRFPLGRSFYNTDNKNFTTKTKTLKSGDQIFLFSDGYKDQFGGDSGNPYSSTKFHQLLKSTALKPIENQRVFIEDTFYKWKGNIEQIDDVLVIGLVV